jgi:phage terminase small subunit
MKKEKKSDNVFVQIGTEQDRFFNAQDTYRRYKKLKDPIISGITLKEFCEQRNITYFIDMDKTISKPSADKMKKSSDKKMLVVNGVTPAKDGSGLTHKQEMFCREYIIDGNATRAAIAAGYSEKTAYSIGEENLKKPEIMQFIEKLRAPIIKKLDISAERILEEYAKMAFANLHDFLGVNEDGTIQAKEGLPFADFTGVTKDQMAGLDGLEIIMLPPVEEDGPNPIKVKMKLADKKGALDVLAKRAGLLKEHIEHSGKIDTGSADPADIAKRVAFLLQKAAKGVKKDGE